MKRLIALLMASTLFLTACNSGMKNEDSNKNDSKIVEDVTSIDDIDFTIIIARCGFVKSFFQTFFVENAKKTEKQPLTLPKRGIFQRNFRKPLYFFRIFVYTYPESQFQ